MEEAKEREIIQQTISGFQTAQDQFLPMLSRLDDIEGEIGKMCHYQFRWSEVREQLPERIRFLKACGMDKLTMLSYLFEIFSTHNSSSGLLWAHLDTKEWLDEVGRIVESEDSTDSVVEAHGPTAFVEGFNYSAIHLKECVKQKLKRLTAIVHARYCIKGVMIAINGQEEYEEIKELADLAKKRIDYKTVDCNTLANLIAQVVAEYQDDYDLPQDFVKILTDCLITK